eukprot:5175900-Pleurochrysis_carterae.AAC.1
MRALLRGARALTSQWLAVAVPREANTDADRLSHPLLLRELVAEATRAGMRVHVARVPEECWAALRKATEEWVGTEEGTRRRKRR